MPYIGSAGQTINTNAPAAFKVGFWGAVGVVVALVFAAFLLRGPRRR